MMHKIKRAVLMVLYGVVLQSVDTAAGPAHFRTGPEPGKAAPELSGHTLKGESYRLQDDVAPLKVVNFFWIECLPCKQELPKLGRMEAAFPKVRFVSVHTRDEPDWVVEQFIKSLAGAPKTIVVPDKPMRDVFNYAGLPHTIVLDRQNRVVVNLVGYTAENLRRLQEILSVTQE